MEITNEKQVYIAKQIIETIDRLIDAGYNKIKQTTDFLLIVKYEEIIYRLKRKRLGFWGLLVSYQAGKIENDSSNKIEIYVVQEDVTLIDVSNAYYGRPEYAGYIYIANDLETDEIQIGQILVIPELKDPSLITNHELIVLPELYNEVLIKRGELQ